MHRFQVILLSLLLVNAVPAEYHLERQPSNFVLAIVDVNLISMESDRIAQNQTVIVENGIIKETGPSKRVTVPEGSVRIDGRNKYLIPGLADMHVHVHTRSDLLLWMANGVTVLRNMRGTPLHLAWRSRIEEGKMLGPDLYTAGPILDGFPPTGDSVTIVENPGEVDALILKQKQDGYQFVKIYNRLSPEVVEEISKSAARHQMPVIGHVPLESGIDAAFAGQTCIEHLTGYMKALKNRAGVVHESQIPVLAKRTAEAGVWNCPTLVVQKRMIEAENSEQILKRPEVQYVSPIRVAMWQPSRIRQFQSFTAEDFTAARRGFEVLQKVVKALKQKKAKILTGTDSPSYFVVPGFSIHEELQHLVDSGLTPYEALYAATVAPAAFLNRSHVFGKILPGMRADMVLLQGNPFKNISNTQKIAGVAIRGEWIDQDRIREMLDAVKASYKVPGDGFAELGEMPGSIQARYVIKTGDIEIGAERISHNGPHSFYAQQFSYPPFDSSYVLQMKMESRQQHLELVSKRFEGEGRVNANVTNGRLHLSANLPYQKEYDRVEMAAERLLPANSALAVTALPVQELRDWKVGDGGEFRVIEMNYGIFANQNFELKESVWSFRRYEDKPHTIGGRTVSGKVFSGAAMFGKQRRRIVFGLDDDGLPLFFTRGGLTFERVE